MIDRLPRSRLLPFLLLCLLWSGSLAVRRAVLAQQTRTAGGEAPFVLESALQYRMTRLVYEEGGLPRHEPKIQVPEGVEYRKTYEIGAEYVYAALARLLPSDWSLARRLRWISAGLFCLGIPFAALWAGVRWQSVWAAAMAACVLAASPAFVVRSTGLALSRENLAMPVLVFFLLAETLAHRAAGKGQGRAWAFLAGLSLALAQATWDLSQFLIGLWICKEWAAWLFRRPRPGPATRRVLFSAVACLSFAALANPYLRSHSFLLSPVMALVLARAAVEVLPARRRGLSLGVAALVVAACLGGGRLFAANYSHFGELLLAKIRFLNDKPADPALLTYAQRILWTPALNSSTKALTFAYFPATLWISALAIPILWMRRGKSNSGFPLHLIFYALATLPLYVLFFRFHVFLIVFLAGILGGFAAILARSSSRTLKILLPSLALAGTTGFEMYHLLFFEPKTPSSLSRERTHVLALFEQMGADVKSIAGNRWGHPGQSYTDLQDLAEQLRAIPESDRGPVLAHFGVSGSILESTGFPILLHPKFETPEIRERVRAFLEHLFLRDEKAFRDWAIAHGARWYVHSMGSLAGGDTRDAPRYMVDALSPPPEAAVHVLESQPESATWFRPVSANRKYRIYRLVTEEDLSFAESMTAMARKALDMGDRETARRRAMEALRYHWKHEPAREVIRQITLQDGRF